MSFCKSILFGTQGSYNVLGFPVEFQDYSAQVAKPPERASCITRLVYTCLNTMLECCCTVTLARPRLLIHELGHAIAIKSLTDETPKIVFNGGGAVTLHEGRDLQNWEGAIYYAAGPLFHVACSICLVVALIAIAPHVPATVETTLFLLSAPGIVSESLYALQSAYLQDTGDFGMIRKIGVKPFAMASMALAGSSAFGAYLGFTWLGKLA